MSLLVWQDGRWQSAETPLVSAVDGGFLYGDTLFESLPVRDGRALFLREHLDRLELSARLSQFPFDRSAITALLREALAQSPFASGRLRLTLSRGEFQGLTFPTGASRPLLTVAPYSESTPAQREQGWRAVSAPNQRVNPLSHLPQLKRGSYADCLYAFNHARSCGADEALFFTPEGQLLEGSISNILLVKDGQLRTPQLGSLVLAGVIRRQLLSIAEEMALEAVETELQEAELFAADEVLLCNSLMLIMPLAELDGRPLPRGERWRELLQSLEKQAVQESDE
ncbi:MAG TPA: aminotransferase class IV [Geothermobacteraceae bacterium]|nr:aminotransferase class IV [Geothermobacteraceae bacterium]